MFEASIPVSLDTMSGMQRPYCRRGPPAFAEAATACDLLLRRFGSLPSADVTLADDLRHAVIDLYSTPHRRTIGKRSAGTTLHVLVDGWVLRAEHLPDGARQITDILVPGDPYTVLTPAEDASSTMIACGQVKVAILDLEALDEPTRALVEEGLRVALREDMHRLRARVVSLGRRAARERLAHLMAETYARLTTVGLVEDRRFMCPLTQEQLGDALGLTSVHVNRTLRRLHDEGLLLMAKRYVEILDLERLHGTCGRCEERWQT